MTPPPAPRYFWPWWWLPALLPSFSRSPDILGESSWSPFYLVAGCQEDETEAAQLLKANTWKSHSITVNIFYGSKSVGVQPWLGRPLQEKWHVHTGRSCWEPVGRLSGTQTQRKPISRSVSPWPFRYTIEKLYVWLLFSTVLIKWEMHSTTLLKMLAISFDKRNKSHSICQNFTLKKKEITGKL